MHYNGVRGKVDIEVKGFETMKGKLGKIKKEFNTTRTKIKRGILKRKRYYAYIEKSRAGMAMHSSCRMMDALM